MNTKKETNFRIRPSSSQFHKPRNVVIQIIYRGTTTLANGENNRTNLRPDRYIMHLREILIQIVAESSGLDSDGQSSGLARRRNEGLHKQSKDVSALDRSNNASKPLTLFLMPPAPGSLVFDMSHVSTSAAAPRPSLKGEY